MVGTSALLHWPTGAGSPPGASSGISGIGLGRTSNAPARTASAAFSTLAITQPNAKDLDKKPKF